MTQKKTNKETGFFKTHTSEQSLNQLLSIILRKISWNFLRNFFSEGENAWKKFRLRRAIGKLSKNVPPYPWLWWCFVCCARCLNVWINRRFVANALLYCTLSTELYIVSKSEWRQDRARIFICFWLYPIRLRAVNSKNHLWILSFRMTDRQIAERTMKKHRENAKKADVNQETANVAAFVMNILMRLGWFSAQWKRARQPLFSVSPCVENNVQMSAMVLVVHSLNR